MQALHPLQVQLGSEVNPVLYDARGFRTQIASGGGFAQALRAQSNILLIGGADDLAELAGDAPAAERTADARLASSAHARLVSGPAIGQSAFGLSIDNLDSSAYGVPTDPMPRRRHPKPEVEDALRHAEAHGWSIKVGGSHAWGQMHCPFVDDPCRCGEFCLTGIWSTPKNAGNHARSLRRVVDNCSRERARRHGYDDD